jgi:DNA recombination protein RmuC
LDRLASEFAALGPLLQAAALCGLAALVLLAGLFGLHLRGAARRTAEAAAQAERQREIDDKMAELARLNAELAGRVQASTEGLSARQSELSRLLAERLDAVGARVGQGLEAGARQTQEQLAKLGERLAIIDGAQANLARLSQDMLGLKDILANKQARGAFGQGRMETIVRDGLPVGAYEFQATLSNRMRPDCAIRLPGDPRRLIVDAKFPLEAFTALREARDEEARRQAQARVRADVGKHVKDIAERYFLPGETQDIAFLFVPSESIYADVHEHFDDLVQKAHRTRVLFVSPSLLSMAIQLMQAIVRDAQMREEAGKIQIEVARIMEDVGRLRERADKLATHFRQAQEDVEGVRTSARKIEKRGEGLARLEFEPAPPEEAREPTPAPAAALA